MTGSRLVLTFGALWIAACGSSSSTSSPLADAAKGAAVDAARAVDAPRPLDASVGSHLVLNVPGSYTGSPRQLAIVAIKQVPVAGPPDAVFLLDSAPMPHAGQAMPLVLDTSGASGSLYVVAVLYQQGGGQFSPKSGVDYAAQTPATVAFSGAAVDLGTLNLTLAP